MTTLLSFTAEDVETHVEESSADTQYYLIAFSVGDVEVDGHSWSFSRGLDESDDWGVCTVKEIQQATIYECITSFDLHRSNLKCIFDEEGINCTGFSELQIIFELDDRAWKQLADTARIVFHDRPYFTCED
ncbi:hypothetical protein [Chamaesiphon polymorphus]|uniref:Uncharacterized protein n=1 Tax=Chamaesiphon polymorphus CCALA 037 TaxID=2107692 RepID=A0A2T1GFZ8_9CYAN|nr:hypothetical protein [Chamaesiphon polymorphus]PSB56563.1 hypothetical protein C7B77_11445 [Chamaesiphon polymorphus CCALA 037]